MAKRYKYMSPEIWQSQNFIDNPRLVTNLLGMTDVNRGDQVLEVGPGTGAITAQLAERAGEVVAIEQDPHLARHLAQSVGIRHPNVHIVNADFLNYSLPEEGYKVVANIPFNLTADIIRKLFTGRENSPESAYLIMQEEAAGKFTGEPKATLISTLLSSVFEVTSLTRIDRKAFVPTPRVDAAFVAFLRRHTPLVEEREMRDFQDFVAYGYVHTQRNRPVLDSFDDVFTNKQRVIIERELGLSRVGIGDLDISHWVNLFETFKRYVPQDRKAAVHGVMSKLAREQASLPKEHRTRRF